jgi:hypothetical protein
MSTRFTRAERAVRKTATETLFDPAASIQKKYAARLLLKQTEADALARTAARNDDASAPCVQHRVAVAPDPNATAFLAALSAMLEGEDENASAKAAQPGDPDTSDASVAPCAPASEPPPGDEMCMLCLIPRESCGHRINQSDRENSNE